MLQRDEQREDSASWSRWLGGAGTLRRDERVAGILRLARRLEENRLPWWGPASVAARRWRPMRPLIREWLRRVEGGMMFSVTWRAIARHY
ncbi:MAG: hypothetical protein KatS3mg132_010 [Limisphaera sp.]|nr:MAG: hypothetical protein KatS3mg132_010 [Limisphaera sp.]